MKVNIVKRIYSNWPDMKTDISPKVMLIEYNKVDAFIFRSMWQKVFPVRDLVIFNSKLNGIQYLSDDNNKENIEYIFLELEMSAYEENTFLKKFESIYSGYRKRPTVILTTSYNYGRVLQIVKNYKFISHFIEKPITMEDLNELKY